MSRRLAFPGFGQAIGGQAGKTGAQVEARFFATGPLAQLGQPGIVEARLDFLAVHLLGRHSSIQQQLQFIGPRQPGRLELGQCLLALLQRAIEQLAQCLRRDLPLFAQQRS